MYLRVTATYTDRHGDDKTAMSVSAHPVRATPAGGNSAPVFSAGNTDTRKVAENSPPGTAVGKPVTAGDDGDVLTYTLTGTDEDDEDSLFRIDRATGQIMVGPRTVLNREPLGDPFQHTVTVTATDPWGITSPGAIISAVEQEVTITIINVNEAPMIRQGLPGTAKQRILTPATVKTVAYSLSPLTWWQIMMWPIPTRRSTGL